jgi:hypothetical protein
MKWNKVVLAYGLLSFATSSPASACFGVDKLLVERMVERFVQVCATEVSVPVEYARARKFFSNQDKSIVSSCFNSCRKTDREGECEDRIITSAIRNTLDQMRGLGLRHVCTKMNTL